MSKCRRVHEESSDEDDGVKPTIRTGKFAYRPDSEEMMQTLENLMVRLSDYDSLTMRNRIDDLCFFVSDTLESYKKDLLRLLIDCVATHPMQSGAYATVVGLLNVRSYEFGGECVARVMQQFLHALYEGSWDKAQSLIMLLADLVNTNVVTVDSMLQLLNVLADVCEKEEDSPPPRRDFYAHLVLITLPLVGRELYEKKESALHMLIKRLHLYVKKDRNKAASVQLLRIWNHGEMPQHESLELLWQQILRLERDHWIEYQLQRPYVAFDELLSPALQHHFSVLKPPAHVPDLVRYPRERLIFHLFELIDFPNRMSLPEESDIERYVIEAHIRELLQLHHLERKECADKLLAYCAAKPMFALEHCVVELLLCEMLQLPNSPYMTLNYGAIIIELCKRQPDKFPRAVALAADVLFNQLESMSVSSFDRFVNWFSHHLSNFRYQWNWEDWASCTTLPRLHPSAMFVQELLKKCIRLSYYKHIVQLVPQSFTPLLPLSPDPIFKYFNELLPGAKLAKHLLEAMRSKCSAEVVGGLIEATTDLDRFLKINVLVQSFLHLGCKSFTHIFAIFSKFKPVLKMLVNSKETQLALLGALFELWINNEQLKAVLCEKLLHMKVLDANVIVTWAFHLKNDLCNMYLWELINATIKYTKKDIQQNGKISDDAEEQEKQAGRLQCLLINIVQSCAKVLMVHKPRPDIDDMDYWFKWVLGRLQAVFFRYIDDFRLISGKLRQIAADLEKCKRLAEMIDDYLDYIQ
ncbi:hypothetical protein KR222_002526 [Zaprionus bogoriensis]|nr:hypothetical protein KR222_002526 [Zaprionus bogoriensis]